MKQVRESPLRRWWQALRMFMDENDRAHRAEPAGWRSRVDAVYLRCSGSGVKTQRRQQWQNYEKS